MEGGLTQFAPVKLSPKSGVRTEIYKNIYNLYGCKNLHQTLHTQPSKKVGRYPMVQNNAIKKWMEPIQHKNLKSRQSKRLHAELQKGRILRCSILKTNCKNSGQIWLRPSFVFAISIHLQKINDFSLHIDKF